MASPPVLGEGAAAHVAAPKNAALGEGSTVRRPGRLRVMHPHVAEFLRSPRRVRAKKSAPPPPSPPRAAEGEGEEERERARYGCAFEDDEEGARGGFAPPRLVWGKVRHHPWWPGQVFDPADASELAQRQQRRRRAVLVAYFRDKSFAWVDAAALRPFRGRFPRLASQSALSPFAAAVDAALDEVARRVDAGLSCFCAGAGNKGSMRQVIDNAGVREGAYGAAVEAAFARRVFGGEAFVAYISALATAPLAGADRVDLTIATAQLKAFSRWRGSRGLPEYTFFHGIEGVAMESARAKRRRSRGDDVVAKWKMSRCRAKGNGACESEDYDALESEDFPLPTPQQMSTKIGMLMSRAAQQMSRSPVICRANGNAPPEMSHMAKCTRVAAESPSVNNGDLKDDHICKVPVVDERRPAEEMEKAGVVLNFSSENVVPSTNDLTMIFSRFGPIKEIKTENSVALVIFKKRVHAEEAFSGTAKISAISASLMSFRLAYSLPAAPIDPPQSMLSTEIMDPLPVEAVQ